MLMQSSKYEVTLIRNGLENNMIQQNSTDNFDKLDAPQK